METKTYQEKLTEKAQEYYTKREIWYKKDLLEFIKELFNEERTYLRLDIYPTKYYPYKPTLYLFKNHHEDEILYLRGIEYGFKRKNIEHMYKYELQWLIEEIFRGQKIIKENNKRDYKF